MADIIPHYFIRQQAIGEIDFPNDEFKCVLCSGTYDETLRDVRYYYELSAYEITSGCGYELGGIDVSGTSVTTNDTDDTINYFADDMTFIASGGDIHTRFAAMYDITGQNTVVYFFDFGEDKIIFDGGTLQIKTSDIGFMRAYQG